VSARCARGPRLFVLAAGAATLGMSLGVSVGGCADNAVLELELELPAAADGRGHAYVETLSTEGLDGADFDGPWEGRAVEQGFALGSSRSMQDVSVVASGASLERALGVRVRFCSDARCEASADSTERREARWVFERAFYRGRRMTYRLVVPAIPAVPSGAPVEVGRCQVGHGCAPGTSLDDPDFCRPDGRHLCE